MTKKHMSTPYYEITHDSEYNLTEEEYLQCIESAEFVNLWWEIKETRESEESLPFGDCTFQIDYDQGVVVPRHMSQGLFNIRVHGLYNFDEFRQLINTADRYRFDFGENRPEGIESEEKYTVNYSVIIKDLVAAGLVRTKRTNSWMSHDPRKFWIVEDEDENDARDVDCLGTSLFQNLTRRIVNMWKGVKGLE